MWSRCSPGCRNNSEFCLRPTEQLHEAKTRGASFINRAFRVESHFFLRLKMCRTTYTRNTHQSTPQQVARGPLFSERCSVSSSFFFSFLASVRLTCKRLRFIHSFIAHWETSCIWTVLTHTFRARSTSSLINETPDLECLCWVCRVRPMLATEQYTTV